MTGERKSSGANITPKYMKELRHTLREDLPQQIQQQNLLDHFAGVVGLDFGEVCLVTSVFIPEDPNAQGSQLVIKQSPNELYSKQIPTIHIGTYKFCTLLGWMGWQLKARNGALAPMVMKMARILYQKLMALSAENL
ncbi:hypothetical protein BDA99DRAFT_538768 [Phascolomyces articulosus]|uniref:Uncharacterized protein n=1 Tax=Phascolomyces articulosus TaxID=60185 RepID=A0AAD5JX53_9FUNG|nr:hypothetical protein BDA99DRAFT_538768 [Phascolomyces articulosus]